MARPSLDALGRENLKKDFPLRKIGHPDDIAGATVYLLSDLANHVTGITLTVDGGIDMRG
jgi:NAD(P)-dependent dehydrogenase (short-subunit alcohol dehydrogenase family)